MSDKIKKILIDTNILYILAGLDDNDKNIKIQVLKNEISKFNTLAVSEISLFELFTHKGFAMEQYEKVCNFISNSRINIVQSFDKIHSLVCKANKIDFKSKEQMNEIKNIKIDLESQTLRGCIIIIAYIFYYLVYLFVEEGTRGPYTFQINALLEGNSNYLLNESKKILMDYYYKDLPTKNRINNLLNDILYAIFLNYEASSQGILLSELSKKENMQDSTLPLYEIKNKIMSSSCGILNKKYWNRLDESIDFLEKNVYSMSSLVSEKNYISYYCCYAKKFFTQGKKFDKNNLFDSLFHFYDDSYIVYTLDEFLTETYKDSNQYLQLINLQKKIKIK